MYICICTAGQIGVVAKSALVSCFTRSFFEHGIITPLPLGFHDLLWGSHDRYRRHGMHFSASQGFPRHRNRLDKEHTNDDNGGTNRQGNGSGELLHFLFGRASSCHATTNADATGAGCVVQSYKGDHRVSELAALGATVTWYKCRFSWVEVEKCDRRNLLGDVVQ
jgi:hypothetical protein